MATPLISPLKTQGGTFYSLISPTKDITAQFGDDAKVVLSNFVCLNLPNINVTPVNNENYIQLNGIQSAVNSGIEGVTDLNIALAQHFQNYILNYEQLLLDQTDYVRSKLSVGERVFFKWLKEVGGIRFRLANASEKNSSISEPRFVEEDDSDSYNRVVKYVGDISLVNLVERGGVSYQESYMLIPTNTGSTPDILFKINQDSNYNIGDEITGTNEFIEGQSLSNAHPQGLSVSAYYDDDINNTYEMEDTLFTDPSNSTKSININSGTLEFLRTNLDGISIDFDPFSYQKIASDVDIQSIQEFNGTKNSSDFEFNTVLVYYRVSDKGNPLDNQINLFGVLFLDQIQQTSSDGAFIERYKKYKFDGDSNQLGNSWGFKLNTQITSNDNDVTVETIINEYNTFSMSIFSDLATNVQNILDITQNYQTHISSLSSRIDALELQQISENLNFASKIEFNSLKSDFENANLLFSNTEAVLELISQQSDKLNQIINGETNANLVFDFTGINNGDGIKLDKSASSVTISSTATSYNKPSITEFNEIGFTTEYILNSLNNYNKLSGNDSFTLTENYSYIINNKNISWVTGQNLKISFGFDLNLDIFNFDIYTYDLTGENLIRIFSLNNSNKSKIIDIICIDQNILQFSVDLIN